MPFAWAFILASVGLRIRKLQLLHPAGGVRDAPLSDASAGAGAVTIETNSDDANAAVASRTRLYMTLLESNRPKWTLMVGGPSWLSHIERSCWISCQHVHHGNLN